MSAKAPPPDARERRDRILAARPVAARAALRLGARNSVGLTNDDLRALADEGLMAADAVFDPGRGVELGTLAYPYVRGAVLRAMRDRRRVLAHEVSEDVAQAAGRRRDRRALDDLGAGLDADAVDIWEDTDEDLLEEAREVAEDSVFVAVLSRVARATGGAEAALIAQEMLDALDAEIGSLPAVPGRLIRLRFYEERTGEEIAELTGMSRSTVYEQIAQAVRLLRRRMTARDG